MLNIADNAFVERRSALLQPILIRINVIIAAKRGLTPAQSLLGKALNYAYGQWQFFCNYLLHPALGPISNQLAENGIRPFVVGRKKYLFAGHPNGARVLGVYYSLIETAKVNGVRPLNYLKHVFSHIRSIPGNRIAELLPWNCGLQLAFPSGSRGALVKRQWLLFDSGTPNTTSGVCLAGHTPQIRSQVCRRHHVDPVLIILYLASRQVAMPPVERLVPSQI